MNTDYKPSIDRVQGSRKDASDEEDEDALFAELEAELENADSAALRDRGTKEMRAQLRSFSSHWPLNRSIDQCPVSGAQVGEGPNYGTHWVWTIHRSHRRERSHQDERVSRLSIHRRWIQMVTLQPTYSNEPRCVIHFFHRDFKRCEIMDKHLAVSTVSFARCVLVDRMKI